MKYTLIDMNPQEGYSIGGDFTKKEKRGQHMALQFCSFASGSSGNCYMIKKDDMAVLIDVGISGKRIFQGLEETATPLAQVAAILITHEHIDHVKSLPVVSKKIAGSRIYTNEKTWICIPRKAAEERWTAFITGRDFYIGDIRVRPFAVPHDAAEPVGFSFFTQNRQISIVTDAGYITDEIFKEILSADLLVLEANHEVEVLQMGNYPYHLKRRILGEKGHLSNVTAADCICKLQTTADKARRILLGHLSQQNNDPALAQITVENILRQQEIHIGGSLKMDVILRDGLSTVYEV